MLIEFITISSNIATLLKEPREALDGIRLSRVSRIKDIE